MTDVLLTIFWGVVLLSVLIFLHELGHFATARMFGVRVLEFMIGMPGPSVGVKLGETRFGVTAVPLGGYARIAGMEAGPENPLLAEGLAYVYRQGTTDDVHLAVALGIEESEAYEVLLILAEWGSIIPPDKKKGETFYSAPEITSETEHDNAHPKRRFRRGERTVVVAAGDPREVEDPDDLLSAERKKTYRGLSPIKRLIVLFAGPLMNLITAILVFTVVLSGFGFYQVSTTIDSAVSGSPAAEVGLVGGDTITGIDGTDIVQWDDINTALSAHEPGDTVELEYVHDGSSYTAQVTLAETHGAATLGVYAGVEHTHLSVPDALFESFTYVKDVTVAIGNLFNPHEAHETLKNSTSIVGISVEAKQAAENGALSFAWLAAAISVSLGLMNLLPIPPLDGGKVIIELVQIVRRKEVSMKVSTYLTIFGIAVFVVLFIYMLFQDVGRYIIGG